MYFQLKYNLENNLSVSPAFEMNAVLVCSLSSFINQYHPENVSPEFRLSVFTVLL